MSKAASEEDKFDGTMESAFRFFSGEMDDQTVEFIKRAAERAKEDSGK